MLFASPMETKAEMRYEPIKHNHVSSMGLCLKLLAPAAVGYIMDYMSYSLNSLTPSIPHNNPYSCPL